MGSAKHDERNMPRSREQLQRDFDRAQRQLALLGPLVAAAQEIAAEHLGETPAGAPVACGCDLCRAVAALETP